MADDTSDVPRVPQTRRVRYNRTVANLGEDLWKNLEAGKAASIRAGRIRYVARCQSTRGCKRNAVIQIECRDNIGHPFWNRDFCKEYAKPY